MSHGFGSGQAHISDPFSYPNTNENTFLENHFKESDMGSISQISLIILCFSCIIFLFVYLSIILYVTPQIIP